MDIYIYMYVARSSPLSCKNYRPVSRPTHCQMYQVCTYIHMYYHSQASIRLLCEKLLRIYRSVYVVHFSHLIGTMTASSECSCACICNCWTLLIRTFEPNYVYFRAFCRCHHCIPDTDTDTDRSLRC